MDDDRQIRMIHVNRWMDKWIDRCSSEPQEVVNRTCHEIPQDSMFTMNQSTLENLSKRGKGGTHTGRGHFFAGLSQPCLSSWPPFPSGSQTHGGRCGPLSQAGRSVQAQRCLPWLCPSVAEAPQPPLFHDASPPPQRSTQNFKLVIAGASRRSHIWPLSEQMGCACGPLPH